MKLTFLHFLLFVFIVTFIQDNYNFLVLVSLLFILGVILYNMVVIDYQIEGFKTCHLSTLYNNCPSAYEKNIQEMKLSRNHKSPYTPYMQNLYYNYIPDNVSIPVGINVFNLR